MDVMGARVAARQKRGPAGRADRALSIGAGKSHTLFAEGVEIRGMDVRVAQCVDGVISLLVGTIPQNVRWFVFRRNISSLNRILGVISIPRTQSSAADNNFILQCILCQTVNSYKQEFPQLWQNTFGPERNLVDRCTEVS